ncbi:hypothetical protein ACFL4L_07080 [bacterium]
MSELNEDAKQVDLLSTFHYVMGGLTALGACIPFVHVFMGLLMTQGSFFNVPEGDMPPPMFGWLFVVLGLFAILCGWAIAISMIIAGKKLKERKSRIFCMVVAGIECMFMPLGTVLGVFTLIILNRDSVRELFK